MEEFRIGNYIIDYETEPYYFKIEEIKYNEQGNLACYYRKGSCWSIAPNRVELTEEILLKCGFEEDGQLFHNQIALYKNGLDGFNYNVNFFEYDNLEEIKYLHQLQNLYFALTNEELTVNL